jgi:hypothetical protein
MLTASLVYSGYMFIQFSLALRPVHLAYQPLANSTFLSEQISHQQPTSGTFLSIQINTSHQPNEQAVESKSNLVTIFFLQRLENC